MKKLVLIDGNSLLNRAFYATPLFTTQSGTPTNAVFGFVKLMLKICSDLKPEYLIVAFDLKAPTFRHKMYEGYKATRKPMPEELAAQLQPLKSLLSKMGVATCEKEGLEADDIIGTLSNKFNVHSYIYTGDRDSYQLVDEKTDVYYTKRGVSDLLKLNVKNFKETLGYNPCQVIDLKALMGDKSDNIPGVPGIGEKTALDLVNKYGSLAKIYENISELKGAIKEKLSKNKEIAELSYKLATIDRNCQLNVELDKCVAPCKFGIDVKKAFAEFEFKSLLSLDIFEETENENSCGCVLPEKITEVNFSDLKKEIESNSKFAVHLTDEKINLYFSGKEYELQPEQTLFGKGLDYGDYIAILKLLFGNENNCVTAYNFKDLLHLLKSYGVECVCDYNDLSLVTYLSDYTATNLKLNELIEYHSLNKNYPAFSINSIFTKYYASLSSDKIVDLYEKIEKPLLKILFEMEDEGVRISEVELNNLSKKLSEKIKKYASKIYAQAGTEFNVNSPMQLSEILFDKLGLKAGKKIKMVIIQPMQKF